MSALPESIPASVRDRLDELSRRRDELACQLSDPEVLADHTRVRDLSIAKAALDPLVDLYQSFRALEVEADELADAITAGDDPEYAQLARDELPKVKERAAELAAEILEHLVTSDDQAVASVILEIRSGVGGDEASLWAGDVLTMYQKFAADQGWSFEMMDASPGDAGGVTRAVATISGSGVWTLLSSEAGTHCVKRVPATESQGRIHTSTATVAVLAEPTQVQVEIDPADVQEHITTSQGPGGQNVNKVATAVHLIHTPTGVEVRMQETKSQRQNREKAWRLLRARLYELEREKQAAQRAADRAGQIGSAGRAERIRTYRYKENIVVDHRLGESFNLSKTLAGELTPIADALHKRDVAQRLAEL